MRSSEMTPGPLGIFETRPTSLAPAETASAASSREARQQILTMILVEFMNRSPPKREKPSGIPDGGIASNLAPQVGLEPTTLRLTAECSTIELLRNKLLFPKGIGEWLMLLENLETAL